MVKKNLFGSPKLTMFYQSCKDFIFEHKFYEVYRLENTETEAVLTLFNFYRYTKNHKTGLIRVEYWCLVSQQWKKERAKKDLKYCYTIPFFESSFLKSLIIIQDNVIRKIVAYLRKKYLENKNSLLHYEDKLVEILKKYLQRRSIILQNYANHTKRLTKWLWQYFWDKSIVSTVIKIEGHRVHLGHYLFYQKHIDKLARVTCEYPNLFPLLSQINPRYWDDPNLFSYHYWVAPSDGETPQSNQKNLY
ncbi:hypothetical protein [Avibacterium endocarditidis]|uniref:DUF4130 domain-containing protein n=1 Tax=Avibacterium endocarditidis TaxID=380674 RepID=A0ABX4ZX61_9PAST|nr:hypothetical protein [Avibacterium endocarditidis]POY43202.1 hypothetical protein C3Z13_00535 [Avibacterium endocarditidis]